MDTNPTRDKIIADAKSLPELVTQAKLYDPQLADALTGRALVASKTVWGNFITTGVTWVATKYGFGWDPNTCALVSGVVLLATSAILRTFSNGPITGLFSAKTSTSPVPVASLKGSGT
jgi:hypothetical protein